VAILTGFCAACNLFDTTKELALNIDCTQASPLFTRGSNQSTQDVIRTNWFPNAVSVSLPSLSLTQWQYAGGYVCNPTGSAWTCGCGDATCAPPAWQLQALKR